MQEGEENDLKVVSSQKLLFIFVETRVVSVFLISNASFILGVYFLMERSKSKKQLSCQLFITRVHIQAADSPAAVSELHFPHRNPAGGL